METYKVLQRLGKGAQGVAYLAENVADGHTYVLKKVECQDESEANKAYKEALILQRMQHPYISSYKEFFVHWDEEDSAMYLCIIMEHYSSGNLDKILKIKRADCDNIEEAIIKKWLGQILEALVVIHKNNIIHRDLKPSNVFLQEELNVCMGDFGVATVMADVRTKTRSKVGSMNWMAPEVLDQPYDERSDVWSLGCIILEMSTCACYDIGQMSGRLFEIKHNPQALEDTLSEIGKFYSADLVSVIRSMLTRNYKQRPSTKELSEMPYIMECLKLSSAALNERRKHQQTIAAGKPLPKGEGLNAVVDYLLENINNESCIKTSLEYLAELTKDEDVTVDERVKLLVVQLMRENISLVEVQIAGCHILNNLIINAKSDDVIYSREVIAAVPLAMKSHAGSSQLQLAAISLLMSLSGNELASEASCQVGGVENIVKTMQKFPNNVELLTTCCNALWSLCVNDGNVKQATEEKALQVVCEALRNHSDSAELVESACAAMLSLSMEDENVRVLSELDCVGLLTSAIETHMKNAKVVKNACLALAGVVEPDEESAFKVLTNDASTGPGEESIQGIPILQKAYYLHKDNAEVVESICTLFMEMTEYDDVREEVHLLKVVEVILKEVCKRYKENLDIISPCETALSRLGGGKRLPRPVPARHRAKNERS